MTEQILWEANSQSLTSMASGGRVVSARYWLTAEFLYFERGTLRTDSQQVPIVSVVDVDVKQSMTQKARGIGDLVVHIQRAQGVERVPIEAIPQPKEAQRIINETARTARHEAQTRQNTMHYSNAPPATPPAPPAVTPEQAADPIEQLKRLGELRDAGVVTPEEFEAKKAEILGRI